MKNFLFMFIFLCLSQLIAAQSSHFEYLSPKPNSILNSRLTNIIILQGSLIDRSSISQSLLTVNGSESGVHKGKLLLSDDNRTIVFNPFSPYNPNETVSVKLLNGIKTIEGDDIGSVGFSFKISPLKADVNLSSKMSSNDLFINPGNISSTEADSLPPDFPKVTVGSVNNPSDSKIFIANKPAVSNAPYGNYIIIADNNGNVIKYKKFGVSESNFKVLPDGELSFSEGGRHIVTDTSLTPVDTFKCGNGYNADSHDFLLLPNGHALLFASDREPVDMSLVVPGGKPDATVIGAVIQELDASKNVVFQWRTWDYMNYLPLTSSYIDLTLQTIDYVHGNALDVDKNGNILFSMRHTSNIIKIDRNTGDVIWILGGKTNQFTFINDHDFNSPNYFSFQHDIHVLPNGNITLFDNGDQHSPQYSRGVEYKLDEQNKTATMVWEYRHSPDIYTGSGGSVQRLPNGNTIIGWSRGGSTNGFPIFTEVHPDNSIAMEMFFPEGEFSYRSYKFPWVSQVSSAEVTVSSIFESNTYEFNNDTDTTGITITFNQFDGDTYAEAIVTKYNYAPVNPEFTENAPIFISSFFKIQGQLINSYNGQVHVNLDNYPGISDPHKTVVYSRPEFSNIFISLPTSYDSLNNELVFTTTDFGEFAFGIPQDNEAYPPVAISPQNNEIVNEESPVKLVWGTRGIVKSYRVQIATDSLFNDLIANYSGLTSTSFILDSVKNNTEYFWRVNNTNSLKTSDWSNVYKFYTESPYIKIVYPNGGESIYIDSSYIIRWQSNVNDTLNIELIKGNNLISAIADSATSRTNALMWHVPSSIQLDSSYQVRITSVNHSNLTDVSDNYFSISRELTDISETNNIIKTYKLYQNFPNPFNPSTVINYQLEKSGFVTLKVYDILGREVATLINKQEKAGAHSVIFNAKKLSSGVYFYSLHSGNYFETKKLILLR